jgi:hypothetical protein
MQNPFLPKKALNIRPNGIISENELNDIWQQMNTKETRLNPYENYIQKLKDEEKNKKDDSGKQLIGVEKHHIIPRFDI